MNDAIILHLMSNYVKTLIVKKVCICIWRLNTTRMVPQKRASNAYRNAPCRPESCQFERCAANHFGVLKRRRFFGFKHRRYKA